jgi:dipeptidyl aminopeptidase/acylaminoacyl peptidase
MTHWIAALLSIGIWITLQPPVTPPSASVAPTPDPDALAAFAYERQTTTDALGRTITFYLSKPANIPDGGAAAPLPLAVCVQGSGSQSEFLLVDTPKGKRIASGGPGAVMQSQFRERLRVLVVEKPGVDFLVQPSQPGSATEGSESFRKEHTLDRWVEALRAAADAALAMPGIDPSRVLAVGHSEGGQVVCHLAAKEPRITHVAALAGGGPTQLFDLLDLARRGKFGGGPGSTPEAAVRMIEEGWKGVLAEPEAYDKFYLGHPYRRWSSFLRNTPVNGALASKAKFFLAQGTEDSATSIHAADVLYAELLAHGRDVRYERVEGGDHGFMTDAERAKGEGWNAMFREVGEWFLRDH